MGAAEEGVPEPPPLPTLASIDSNGSSRSFTPTSAAAWHGSPSGRPPRAWAPFAESARVQPEPPLATRPAPSPSTLREHVPSVHARERSPSTPPEMTTRRRAGRSSSLESALAAQDHQQPPRASPTQHGAPRLHGARSQGQSRQADNPQMPDQTLEPTQGPTELAPVAAIFGDPPHDRRGSFGAGAGFEATTADDAAEREARTGTPKARPPILSGVEENLGYPRRQDSSSLLNASDLILTSTITRPRPHYGCVAPEVRASGTASRRLPAEEREPSSASLGSSYPQAPQGPPDRNRDRPPSTRSLDSTDEQAQRVLRKRDLNHSDPEVGQHAERAAALATHGAEASHLKAAASQASLPGSTKDARSSSAALRADARGASRLSHRSHASDNPLFEPESTPAGARSPLKQPNRDAQELTQGVSSVGSSSNSSGGSSSDGSCASDGSLDTPLAAGVLINDVNKRSTSEVASPAGAQQRSLQTRSKAPEAASAAPVIDNDALSGLIPAHVLDASPLQATGLSPDAAARRVTHASGAGSEGERSTRRQTADDSAGSVQNQGSLASVLQMSLNAIHTITAKTIETMASRQAAKAPLKSALKHRVAAMQPSGRLQSFYHRLPHHKARGRAKRVRFKEPVSRQTLKLIRCAVLTCRPGSRVADYWKLLIACLIGTSFLLVPFIGVEQRIELTLHQSHVGFGLDNVVNQLFLVERAIDLVLLANVAFEVTEAMLEDLGLYRTMIDKIVDSSYATAQSKVLDDHVAVVVKAIQTEQPIWTAHVQTVLRKRVLVYSVTTIPRVLLEVYELTAHHPLHWSFFVVVACLRAYQLVDLFRFWSNIEQDFSKSVSLCVVAKFAFMIFAVAHTLGCVYYYMAALSEFSAELYKENWLDDWISQNDINYSHENKNLGSMYLVILYRGFNILTALGYQEDVPFRGDEIALSIVGNYVKIVAEAYIFGLIFHYLVKPNPEVQANRKRLAAVEQYCDARNLSQELTTRLSKYMQFQQSQGSAVSDQVLATVPTSLKERISAERCTSVVFRNMHVFGGCSTKFFSRFMMCLQEVHLMPSEVLLKAGDIARELSFVEVGNLQILDATDQVVEIVAGEGTTPCVVGATSFFMGVPEQYKVCSRHGEECALLAINKATCNDVIASLPEENDNIITNILAQYGLTKEGEETGAAGGGGGGGGGDNDAFAAVQEAIKSALQQTQDRALEQLTYAASAGDLDTVEMLLTQGCAINTGDYDQRTPLHLAVSKGQMSVVQLLLDRGAKVSPIDRWGGDPLQEALMLNHLEIADMLIARGGRVMSEHYVIIREAAANSLSKLQRIVTKGGADADVGDCDSRTLLHCAAAVGDFSMVQNLIAVGANPHLKDRWGGTPIEDAIKNNQALITAFLAMQGARASSKYQQEALFHAAQVGSVQLVNILAESGAELSSQNYDRISAMHVAASENNVAALAAIVSNRHSNVNLKDAWGRTPIDYAVAGRSWPCVVLLAKEGGIITDASARETLITAKACKLLPDLHLVRQSLNFVTSSHQPDAAALGALYGVQRTEGAHLVLAQQRKLLSSNLKALTSLRQAGDGISSALNDVMAIAKVLNEVLSVTAPKGLSKSLTKTASMLAKPRKSLTKALMPVLMRGTAVQEACQELTHVVDKATAASSNKEKQLKALFKATGLRIDQMSIDIEAPLSKSFWQSLAGPAGMEELNVFALLSCPVFRRVVEEAVFNVVRNGRSPNNEYPLVLKLATCLRWSDELWAAMVPRGSTFEMTSVAPMVYQVLKTMSLDHLWDVLSKLLEERHDSLSKESFSYVFFMWLGMSEQILADEEDFAAGNLKRGSFITRRVSSFTFGDWRPMDAAGSGERSLDSDGQQGSRESDDGAECSNDAATVDWYGLFEHADPAAQVAHDAGGGADDEKERRTSVKTTVATDDDRAWLEGLIALKGPHTALKRLLRLSYRESVRAMFGFDISNIEKGRRIFESVNRSESGVLPASVLDVLTSHFQQELRFKRAALDLVEKYQDARTPLRQDDFDAVFALLSSPGDESKFPPDAPWYIIHPNSRALRYWNSGVMALGLWFLWEVPFSIAFRPEHSFGESFMDMNWALEMIFFCDMLGNFVRAFYSDNGTMVYQPRKIARAYMSQYMCFVDIFAFFPFNMMRTIGAHGRNAVHVGAWFRLPRLIAVARVLVYRRDGRSLFQQNFSDTGEISASVMFYRILTLLSGVTCLTHLLACCWWYIGAMGQPHNLDTFEDMYGEINYSKLPPSWIFYYHGLGYGNLWDDKVPVLVQYYYSFYWTASTLSTSGLVGETTPKNLSEIAFTIACMLATITVWSYVMGEISNLVMSSSERLVAIREKVQLVQTFLRKRQLTRDLANDIVSVFYEKVHTNDDTAQVFSSLSSSLMFEVAMHLSLPLVKSLEIFSLCSSSFMASLSVLLREKQLASDEALFLQGDAATSLYVLASSSITLTVPGIEGEDVECGRLGPGSVVGEVAFFFRLRHINSAIVGSQAATLFVLSRPDYDQLCSSYVNDSELVMKKMVDVVNGGGKAGASQASSSNGEFPDNVRRTLSYAVKRQTESVTLALIDAAAKGNAQVVRDMVDAGRVHIDDSDYDARTALHLAASNNHLELVQIILNDFGASIAPRDRCMGTPLDDAVRHRHFDVVRYLASSHLQRIEMSSKYIDMWIKAAASDDVELLQVLLLAGMDCNVANVDNRTALHVAVCKRSFAVVKHLLTLEELHLGPMDRIGCTPMWDALVSCDGDMCRLLADKRAPVQEGIATYMCNAAAADNATFIDLACEYDVDILCRDLFGRTPLHVAASNGALRCVDAMVRKLDGKINTVDVFGATPLDNAVQADDDVAVAILRHAGGLRGDHESLTKAHEDLKGWTATNRCARQARHLDNVAAQLPEARVAKTSAAVAQALQSFVRDMYTNTNIFTVALHEAARKHMEGRMGPQGGSQRGSQSGSVAGSTQMACGSTSAESRVRTALAAIVASLTDLHDVLTTRPKPYTVLDHAMLRKVGGNGRAVVAQIRDTAAALSKVIGVAGKVLANQEQQGLRLQSFAVKRLLSMLSSGIWKYLNVKVPECVLEMSDDELSYVKSWDRSDVHQHMLEKVERRFAALKVTQEETQEEEEVPEAAPVAARRLIKG